jgi:hypothetical protein
MQLDLDHAHIFASNIDETVRWWKEMFDAKVVFDIPLAGLRAVRLVAGKGRHPHRCGADGKPAAHHLGILTDDLEGLVSRWREGVQFRDPIRRSQAAGSSVMAPDDAPWNCSRLLHRVR